MALDLPPACAQLDLTAGIIPGFATPAALLGFAAIKGWLALAEKMNFKFATQIPFSRQVTVSTGLPVSSAALLCTALPALWAHSAGIVHREACSCKPDP